MQRSPVSIASESLGIPVSQPEAIKLNTEFRTTLEKIRPEVIVVVAYGRIIPEWMLALPRLGNINLHGSLLPKYRGAAPIQWAVANGEKLTGVTTMLLDKGLDTGPMLLAQAVPIGTEETAEDVYEGLAALGADLMVRTLAGLEDGTMRPMAQDHTQATLARALKRMDGFVDFAQVASVIYDRWRGFQPWPGAFTVFRGKNLIFSKVKVGGSCTGRSGEIVICDGDLMVICGQETCLILQEVQLEGKRRMSGSEFVRGYQVKTGEQIGR